jgi:hypothetical protein
MFSRKRGALLGGLELTGSSLSQSSIAMHAVRDAQLRRD